METGEFFFFPLSWGKIQNQSEEQMEFQVSNPTSGHVTWGLSQTLLAPIAETHAKRRLYQCCLPAFRQ